jgi:hypothetical protein
VKFVDVDYNRLELAMLKRWPALRRYLVSFNEKFKAKTGLGGRRNRARRRRGGHR